MDRVDARHAFDRWQAGDSESLDTLLRYYLPQLKTVVRRQLGYPLRNKLDSDDIVQEVLRSFVDILPRYEIQDENHFVNLLGRLVRNAISARYHYFSAERRALRRDREAYTDELRGRHASGRPLDEPSVSEVLVRNEQVNEMLKHLFLLEASDQEALGLRLDGLEYAEIGERLEISSEAARKRYDRAVKRLLARITEARKKRGKKKEP